MKVKHLLCSLAAVAAFTITACNDGGSVEEEIYINHRSAAVNSQQVIDGYQESILQNVKANHPEDYKQQATVKKAAAKP